MTTDAGCAICDIVANDLETPGGIIWEDEYWVLCHHPSERGRFPGRVLLSLKRHGGGLDGMSIEEATGFGHLVARGARALHATFKPARVYLASFNEQSQHVHAHLIMRDEDSKDAGPTLLLRRMGEVVGTSDDAAAASQMLRDWFANDEAVPGPGSDGERLSSAPTRQRPPGPGQ